MRVALLLAVFGSARAQEIKVTLLGTGTPRPMIERFGMSTLVQAGNETLLFDAGRGCTIRLAQAGVPLKDVTKLFLTHLHSDHTVGIPDLWLTGWIFQREVPLEVWGPKGTKEMIEGLEKAYWYDVHVRRDVDEKFPAKGVEVLVHEVSEGVVYEENGVKVTAFLVDHGPVKPAFGYRVDYGGHSVVLSGDTRPSQNLVKYAQGADVLVHEVYAATAEDLKDPKEQTISNHHTTPEQAGEIFAHVKPRLAVYSHIGRGAVSRGELMGWTRTTYQGPLEVGEDLMRIEVGKEVKVVRFPH
jgi:ribonuclease Z